MHTHPSAPVAGQTDTAEALRAAIQYETTRQGPQDVASNVTMADPNDVENVDCLYRTTLDDVQAGLRLLEVIKPHRERLRTTASEQRVARYLSSDGPRAA